MLDWDPPKRPPYLNYLIKGSTSKNSRLLGYKLGLQHINLGEHNSVHERGRKGNWYNFISRSFFNITNKASLS